MSSVHRHRLVRALDQAIQPVAVSPVYQVGIAAAGLVMVLLIAVYVGLIALIAYGVYWHLVNDTGLLSGARGRSAVGQFVIYLLPAIVGGILVAFMIKPLLSREKNQHVPIDVSEADQPLLHAFVYRLADTVGSPRPKAIHLDCQVNASAGFADGLFGFLRGDLVLTIGLPLVAGLDYRQFTGVIAHEFGHFAQGGGMRLTYVVRSLAAWFARVVYVRDSWDDSLQGAMRNGGHWAIQLVAAVAVFMVWVTRQLLKALFYIAMAVSTFMLRQMEFDADRYEARVAGSGTFAQTVRRLAYLNVATQLAFDELDAAWKERRLADNLPALIRQREKDFTTEQRKQIQKLSADQKGGWFDTHPPDKQRIESAAKENSAGIIAVNAPATELFRNFPELSGRVTVAVYQHSLGNQVELRHLVPTSQLVKAASKQKEDFRSLQRYFQKMLHPLCPGFPERPVVIADPSAAAELVFDLRQQFVAAAKEAEKQMTAFLESDARYGLLRGVRAIIAAGGKIKPAEFKLASARMDVVMAEIAAAEAKRSAAVGEIHHVLALGLQRMELALSLARTEAQKSKSPGRPEPDAGSYDLAGPASADEPKYAALVALSSAFVSLDTMRVHYFELGALLAQLQPQDNSQALVESILATAKGVSRALGQIQSALSTADYPYDHTDRDVTLARFAVPIVPNADAVGDVHQAAQYALDALYSLYQRLMSDLTHRAELMEESLGLARLPEIVEKEEPAPTGDA